MSTEGMTRGGRYAILRFNPDPVRGELVNVGVLLECPDSGQILCDFGEEDRLRKWTKLFDGRVYRSLIEDIRDRIVSPGTQLSLLASPQSSPQSSLLDRFVAEYSGQYEFTEPRMILVEDMPSELRKLRQRFVDPPAAEGEPSHLHGERSRFNLRLKRSLRSRSLLAEGRLVERIPLNGKRFGPLHFDFGYRNGSITLLHGLWLGPTNGVKAVERAGLLGMRIKDVRDSGLTVGAYAVIGRPGENHGTDEITQALGLLEDHQITPVLPNGLDELAEKLEQALFPPAKELCLS